MQGNGSLRARLPAVRRPEHLEGRAGTSSRRCDDAGRLLATETITHSYPHCWRHKTPVIYRAAAQWFIRMDEGEGVFTKDKAPETLRQMALDAIEETSFYPENGKARLRDMIAGRPDWCISRQRSWGVPLPVLPAQGFGRAASAHDGDPRPGRRHRRGGRHRGLEQVTTEEILAGRRRSDAPHYTKSTDILEVWFDSGTTHTTCCEARTPAPRHENGPEADLYLEGHDQHRGWFHSLAAARPARMYGRAPYRGLLTHGFTVDSQGRKMSKSLGNGIDPQEVSKKLGAEIIRLWVAASDYSGDIAGDDKILARVVDAYRRIRNTLRFLLANTSDFDPAKDAVPLGRDAGDRPLRADAARRSSRPRCWRTTRCTSSTRWWPSCRCTARKTWAPSTSTC